MNSAKVIEGMEVKLENRSLFYRRIEPPAPLPPRVPQPAVETKPLTPEETAAATRRAQKKFEPLMLSATVYDRRVTELRWWFENREYRAGSNVDFNLLAGAGEIETDDTIYWLIMGLGNDTAESIAAANEQAAAEGRKNRKDVPSPTRFDPARAQYFLQTTADGAEPPAEALAAIDALHRYYDANRTPLADEYAKREAANAERAEWLKDHPPVPKDTVINFWPKKSRNYRTIGKLWSQGRGGSAAAQMEFRVEPPERHTVLGRSCGPFRGPTRSMETPIRSPPSTTLKNSRSAPLGKRLFR